MREERPESKLAHRFVGPFVIDSDAEGGNYYLREEGSRMDATDGRAVGSRTDSGLERSFPRDKLFEIASTELERVLSKRQRQLHDVVEWLQAMREVGTVQGGPLPASFRRERRVRTPERDPEEGEQRGKPGGRWYVAEKILARRKESKELLVKWQGYPAESSWVTSHGVTQ